MESREEISYVSQQEAIQIDRILMGPLGFTLDQLMVCLLKLWFITSYEKVVKFISTAKNEGGERPPHLKKGYFIQPTIITDVDTSMEIWKEEVFGPVLCVKTFKTEEEANELANDTKYGLGAAILSKDLDRCEHFTKAFQSEIVWINCSPPCFWQPPWGGKMRSGFGRELGEWSLENYQNIKQVTQYASPTNHGLFTSLLQSCETVKRSRNM